MKRVVTTLVLGLAAVFSAAGQTPALTDVSAHFHVATTNERTTLDRATGERISSVDVTLYNLGGRDIRAPLHAVINLSTTVTAVAGALGGPGDPLYGRYYRDLSGQLSQQRLAANGSVSFHLDFRYPRGRALTYTIEPRGNVVSAAPMLNLDPLEYNVLEGTNLTISMTAADSDGDPVVLYAYGSPTNAIFFPTNGVAASGQWRFDAQSGQAGTYAVDFEAKDPGGLRDRRTVLIQVERTNRAPDLEPVDPFTIVEGESLLVRLVGSDPDGDQVTFDMGVLPENAHFLEASGHLWFAPDVGQAGSYSIECRAFDGRLLSAPQTVLINVLEEESSGGEQDQLQLAVDPIESPTLRASARIRGHVNVSSNTLPRPPLTSSLITGLRPTNARQGELLDVTITGQADGRFATAFRQGVSRADFGAGIQVVSLAVAGPSEIVARLQVDTAAAPGNRAVEVITYDETALAIPSFTVEAGQNRITGRLVDKTTRLPIAGAKVFVEGTRYMVETDADGTFELVGVPAGTWMLGFTAPNHELIRLEMQVGDTAETYLLGDVETLPSILLDEQASPSSLVGVLRRMQVLYGTPQSLEELKSLVLDAITLVGDRSMGVRTADGQELNPAAAPVPAIVFRDDILETMAVRMMVEGGATLGECLFNFTQTWKSKEWQPQWVDWLPILQAETDRAWAFPNEPRSIIPIVLFNTGRQMTPDPPRLHPDMALNALQVMLLYQTLNLTIVEQGDMSGVLAEYQAMLDRYGLTEQELFTEPVPPIISSVLASPPAPPSVAAHAAVRPRSPLPGEEPRVFWAEVLEDLEGDDVIKAAYDANVEEAMKMMLGGGTLAGGADLRISAAQNMANFININHLTVSASKLQLALAYGANADAITAIAKQAQNEAQKLMLQKYLVNVMSGTMMNLLRSGAESAIRAITMLTLDAMVQESVKLLKPSPPMIRELSVERDEKRGLRVVVIEFERSAADSGEDQFPPEFYYTLWRVSNGNTIPLFTGAPGQITGPTAASNGYLYHVDPDSPPGSITYFLTCRRIRMRSVPFREWSEAENFFEYWVLGAGWSPGAFAYKFTKDLCNTALDIYKYAAIQDSDPGNRKAVYVPWPDEDPVPPVNLASGPKGETYVSIPLVGSIFQYKERRFDFIADTGFRDPYQVGLACDARGYLYVDNAASDNQFGGRIFRWDPLVRQRTFFGSVNYYSLLIQFAHICKVSTMLAGWSGGEKLFLIDQVSRTVRYLDIPVTTHDWTSQHFEHNVSQRWIGPPEVELRGNSCLAINRYGHVHFSHGDDISWAIPTLHRSIFQLEKPFTQITGIEFDGFDNLYLLDNGWMGGEGGLVMLPQSKRSDSFYRSLTGDPAMRSLFTLLRGVDAGGEMRITDEGRALVWFDKRGMGYRVFGVSGRILNESTREPLRFATVRHERHRVVTDEHGVFHFPGLLTATSPGWISLVVTHDNLTQPYRITLMREGETVLDPMLFGPMEPIALPPSTNRPPPVNTPIDPTLPPPTLIDIPVMTNTPPDLVSTGMTATLEIEIARPSHLDITNGSPVEVVGAVSDPRVTLVSVNVNGMDFPAHVVNGVFSVKVDVEEGRNRIFVSGQSVDPSGTIIVGASPNVDVLVGAVAPSTHTLGGVIHDAVTGFPAVGVHVSHAGTGRSTFTSRLGVWSIPGIPIQEDGTVIAVLEE